MSNDSMSIFINKLITEDFEKEMFERYIDMFSKFLEYVNPDYKYNGTYLQQYIEDYIQVCEMLKKKNKIYNNVFETLSNGKKHFELIIDRIYYAHFFSPADCGIKYIEFNKGVILQKSIEVKVIIKTKELGNEYIFCKKYENYEDKLPVTVLNDLESYLKMKAKRGEDNDIA